MATYYFEVRNDRSDDRHVDERQLGSEDQALVEGSEAARAELARQWRLGHPSVYVSVDVKDGSGGSVGAVTLSGSIHHHI